MIRSLLVFALLALPVAAPLAQQKGTVVRVVDVRGRAIPFAFVQIENGASRVADDSGRVVFSNAPSDKLRLQVRRMGFNPFIGFAVKDTATGEFVADLIPLPKALDAVTVEGRRDTPLARSGFYDRMERVQKGAYSARMITPEEMDLRNPMNISQMLSGDRFVKVTPLGSGQKNIMMSRNPNCAMTILLDGQRALGMLEESINGGSRVPRSMLQSVDELVSAHSVAAIEVYGSMASAPAELQRAAGNSGGCGLIAIWTGSRR